MATPNLTYSKGQTTVSGTTLTPTLPSGTGRVFVLVSCPSNTALTTSSTDWRVHRSELNGTTLQGIWFISKETAGANPGSLVVTSAASTLFTYVAVRSDIVRTRFVFGAAVTGTGTGANPGIVDQLKSQATRYLVALTLNGTGTTSVTPSGYGTVQSQAGASGGAGTFIADKSATSSSDDPGPWTHTSTAYIAQTIALTDAGTSWHADWDAAVYGMGAANQNVPLVGWGDSLMAGATAATGGMAANQIATSRPALWAAGLKAGRAKATTWQGVGGGNVTSGQLASYDSRRSVGAAWDTSRNSGLNSLGGGLLTGPTSGQDLGFTPGGSWDRHRHLIAQYSGSANYTSRIDSGTATALNMNTTPSAMAWSSTFSGTGTTINIRSTGAGGYIAATEVWTNGSPQVSVFNCGWFGSTSTQNAEIANFYSPPFVVVPIGPKLSVINLCSNDPSQGVTTAQTIANNQFMALVGLITGSVVLETPPYASGGTEASQDAAFDYVEALADAMCVGFYRISRRTGWTSYATASANGFMTPGDNHCATAGYADWAAGELAYMDPGAYPLSAPLLTNTSTLYAPSVTPGAATLSPPLYTNASTLYAPTVSPGAVTISPPLIASGATLYPPVVSNASGTQNLVAPLLTNIATLYAPSVAPAPYGLGPPLLTNTSVFYAPTVTGGTITLRPPLIASGAVLYPPTVTEIGPQTISPPLLVNASTLFPPVVVGGGERPPAPPSREVVVLAEYRRAVVAPENRTVIVPAAARAASA